MEETGYNCKIIADLYTPVKYVTKNNGTKVIKNVVYFLMEPIEKVGEPCWEMDKFIWINIKNYLPYCARVEKEVIEEAIHKFKIINHK